MKSVARSDINYSFRCHINGLAESKFLLQLLKSGLYFRNTIIKTIC